MFQVAVRGEASHALELNKSDPTDCERLQSLSGCLMQQNRPGVPRYNARSDPHHGEALTQSRLSAGQGPTPASVGIPYGLLERTAAVFFSSTDQRLM